MFIIPLSRFPDRKKLPLVTLLLILFNFLVFFGLHAHDGNKITKAFRHYANTIVPGMMLPDYIKYLEQIGYNKHASSTGKSAESDKPWLFVWADMVNEGFFLKSLQAPDAVSASDKPHVKWQRSRDEFDHLLGNMLLLFIVGAAVEKILGRSRFFIFYLLAGLGATLFEVGLNTSRLVPGIGASGATAGVMAMFVTLYGLQKIRFFYWVFLYFGFFRAPALSVLPLWILMAFWLHLINHSEAGLYMAHLGGFLTGTLLIAGQRLLGKKLRTPDQEDPVDPLPIELARINGLLGAIRVKEALRALDHLSLRYPRDLSVVLRYYRVSRNLPDSEDYHRATALVLALPAKTFDEVKIIHEAVMEYNQIARPYSRLTDQQLILLIRRLTRRGYPEGAEEMIQILRKRAPKIKQIPDLLLFVAVAFRRSENVDMSNKLLTSLREDFPKSDAAHKAAMITQ